MKKMKFTKVVFTLLLLSVIHLKGFTQTKNIDTDGLSDQLIGYFSFDNPGSGIQCDWGTGKDNVGSLVGSATLISSDSKFSGSALHIDGASGDAYATFDNENSLPFVMKGASEVTIACWIKPFQTGNQYLVSTIDLNGGETVRFEITSDNRIRANTATRNTEGALEFATGTAQTLTDKIGESLALDTWIHIAYVYNSTENTTRIYIDGVKSGEYSTTSYNLVTFNRILNLGAYFASNKVPAVQKQYNGLMDELYFFDRALSESEILTLKELQDPLGEATTYTATFDHDYNGILEQEIGLVGNAYTVSVPNGEREGYTFEGWYTQQNGNGIKLTGEDLLLTEDITYYANWEIIDYTLKLNKSGSIENLTFNINDLPKTIVDDTKSGENFLGWFTDSNYEEVLINSEITSIGDLELWSDFSVNPTFFEVSLSNNNEVIAQRIAKEEKDFKVALPYLPNREDDYRFAGWYTEENGSGENITSYSIINSDITLYAYWVPMVNEDYTTLDISGLSNNLVGYFSFDQHEDYDVVCEDGSGVNAKGDFEGNGALLTSSNTKYSGSALEIDNAYVGFDLDNSTNFRMEGTSALSVACWVQVRQLGEQYILSLTDDNGGEAYRLEVTSDNRFKTFISTYNSVGSPQFSNAFAQTLGHQLNNEVNLNEWIHVAFVYNSMESKTSIYINGVLSGEEINTDYHLVTFNDRKLNIGADVALNTIPAISKNFDGVIDELYFFDRALSLSEINTLKDLGNPVQPLKEYIAVFDNNLGTNSDTLKTTTLQNYEVDPSTIIDPIYSGYTFQGWYSNKEGTGEALNQEQLITLSSDKIYYAKWELTPYVITYHKPDNTTSTEMFYLTDLPKTLADGSYNSDYFTAWYLDEDLSELLIDKQITEIGDIDVWSDFSSNPTFYKVSLSDRGNRLEDNIAKAENDYKLVLPELPNREDNYRFVGWYTQENGEGSFINDYSTIDQDRTLYAHWELMVSEDKKWVDIDFLSDSLIGYFSFDDNYEGDIVCDFGEAIDKKGEHFGGDTHFDHVEKKYSSNALHLNQTYVSFDLENSAPFRMQGASAMSVALWLQPHQIGEQYILSAIDDSGGESFRLEITNQNRFRVIIATHDTENAQFSSGTVQSINHQLGTNINLNEWVHVAFVYDGEMNKTTIYINGTVSGEFETPSYDLVSFDTRKLHFGAYVASNNGTPIQKEYDGLMDEVYFFDRTLSIDEINTIKDLETPLQGITEYVAIFDDNRGINRDTLKSTILENFEVEPNVIEEPSREGYDFVGWYTDKEGNEELLDTENTLTLSGDKIYYAKWQLRPYTITYHKADGIEVVEYYITDLPYTLDNDVKAGEEFIGWYQDADSIELRKNNILSSLDSVEYWAGFTTESEYYIYYLVDNEDTLSARVATKENDYKVDLPYLSPREDNYRFSGWYTGVNGTGDLIYSDSTLHSNGRINAVYAVHSEEVLYAHRTAMLSDEYTSIDIDNLSDNLVGYFSFDSNIEADVVCDEGTGTGKSGDFVGGGVNLNTSTPKYSTSTLEVDNGFVGFDLENSEPFRLQGASAITVACWIQPHQLGDQYILATTSNGGGETLRLEIAEDNKFRVNINTKDSGGNSSTATALSVNHKLGEDVNINEWIHLAVIYKSDENNTLIYVNGEFSGSYSRGLGPSYLVDDDETKKLNIGALYAENVDPSPQNQFDGLIDEIYFFDRALSEEEIISLKDLETPLASITEYIAVFSHENGTNEADTLKTTVINNYEIDASGIENPTREGYTFKGWFTGKNGTGSEFDPLLINSLSTDLIFYADWEFGSDGSDLPVELIDFTGEIKDNEVYLEWSTAMEINNEKFVVQKSNDLRVWIDLVEIEGEGNSSVRVDYNYRDNQLFDGRAYYRLKQIDFDQTFSYSKVIELVNNSSSLISFEAYPNPVEDQLIVRSSQEIDPQKVRIFTALGKKFYSEIETSGTNTITINTSSWLKGVYIISYRNSFVRILKK